MTQGEIEDYVRKVLITYFDPGYFVDQVVAQITYKWSQSQDETYQEGVQVGQESCGDWQD